MAKNKPGKIRIWVKKEKVQYEQELRKLQVELLKFQNHVKEKNLKVLIIFEGRDSAGKGGTIKRVAEHLNPRGTRTVALSKPSDVEKTQWYFQRYVNHLPSGGEIALFDRSWYNRAGVEPVMGFCTPKEHKEFLREVPEFERMIVHSDIIFIKLYLSITKDEQAKRFDDRRNDPLKQYKISPIDEKAQEMWDGYTVAKYSMLFSSNTDFAPWTIVRTNNKREARINAIKYILSQVEYPEKLEDKNFEVDKSVVFSGVDEIEHIENDIEGALH
jgi:polyphosphate kinase 2